MDIIRLNKSTSLVYLGEPTKIRRGIKEGDFTNMTAVKEMPEMCY